MTAIPKSELMARLRAKRRTDGLVRLRIDIWVPRDRHARINTSITELIKREKERTNA